MHPLSRPNFARAQDRRNLRPLPQQAANADHWFGVDNHLMQTLPQHTRLSSVIPYTAVNMAVPNADEMEEFQKLSDAYKPDLEACSYPEGLAHLLIGSRGQ
jgi:hypothetical protein